MRRFVASVAAALSLGGIFVVNAPPASAASCPGGDKNLVMLADPSDPRQVFDVNSNDLICSFKKTYRDDHVHKV